VRLLYNDFSAFTKDQEQLISITRRKQNIALDYLEGLLLMHQGPINNWRSSFFPLADHARIISLVTKHSVLYCLEVAKYYDGQNENNVDKVPSPFMCICLDDVSSIFSFNVLISPYIITLCHTQSCYIFKSLMIIL